MNFILIVVCFILLVSYCHGNTECFPQVCDKSKCCEGYHVIDNECMPICEGGCPPSQVCLEPNKCGCEDNTVNLDRDDRCKLCITPLDYNAIPYTCYKCTPNYTFNNNVCKHLCHDNCTNNDCYIVDGTRKCNTGYQENPNTKACEPIPPVGVVNCIKGSNCDESFSSSTTNDDIIISTTDVTLNCQNGNCQETSSSNSKEDSSFSTTQTTPNCIDGIWQNEETNPSTPTQIDVRFNSEKKCLKGICGFCQETTSATAQNTSNCIDKQCQPEEDGEKNKSKVTFNCQNDKDGTCQCKDGLILNENTNKCIMPCEKNCQNGLCNQDHQCECYQGYVYQNDSVGCVPQCDRECINSICVAPTQCECMEGDISSLNISSAIKCLPTCPGVDGRTDCQNGTCVAINKCQCLDGFFQNPAIDQFECIPVFIGWQDALGKTLEYSIWIIAILALLLIIIALVHLAQERKRLVNTNVGEVDEVGEVCKAGEIGGDEKYRSIVMFEVNEESECKKV